MTVPGRRSEPAMDLLLLTLRLHSPPVLHLGLGVRTEAHKTLKQSAQTIPPSQSNSSYDHACFASLSVSSVVLHTFSGRLTAASVSAVFADDTVTAAHISTGATNSMLLPPIHVLTRAPRLPSLDFLEDGGGSHLVARFDGLATTSYEFSKQRQV